MTSVCSLRRVRSHVHTQAHTQVSLRVQSIASESRIIKNLCFVIMLVFSRRIKSSYVSYIIDDCTFCSLLFVWIFMWFFLFFGYLDIYVPLILIIKGSFDVLFITLIQFVKKIFSKDYKITCLKKSFLSSALSKIIYLFKANLNLLANTSIPDLAKYHLE